MEVGNQTRNSRYPEWHSYPSVGGRGKNFNLFGPGTTDQDVLLISHAIVLSGQKVIRLTTPVPERAFLVLTLLREKGKPRMYPFLEYMGAFLFLRTASPACLALATSWYLEDTRAAMEEILRTRVRVRDRQIARELRGCGCLDCEPEWLDAGWVCPWAGQNIPMRLG